MRELTQLRRARRKAVRGDRKVEVTAEIEGRILTLHPTKGFRDRSLKSAVGYVRGPLTGAELFQSTFNPQPKTVVLQPGKGVSNAVAKAFANRLKYEIRREQKLAA
jgi:hypothetical protein